VQTLSGWGLRIKELFDRNRPPEARSNPIPPDFLNKNFICAFSAYRNLRGCRIHANLFELIARAKVRFSMFCATAKVSILIRRFRIESFKRIQ
jgi:hypothetical protein